jgi:sphingosine kinase
MFDTLQKRRFKDTAKDATDPPALHEPGTESTALPPLKYSATDDEGWTVVTEPLLFVYAGKGPYVGR